MPWYNGSYPPSYKNQPEKLRNKAVEFANALIIEGAPEGIAIATGLKKARAYFSPKAVKPIKIKRRVLTIKVSAEIGKVSAISMVPDNPVCIMAIAHGAGAGMNHPFMEELATSLANAGIASLRFNFPYMEKKKARPDSPAIAHQTIAAGIAKARKLFPALPLFASGKSFGGRMTSQYLSGGTKTDVRGIVFFGFPLHAPGKPSIERADHLKKIKIPMLFLQGSRDEFAEWNLIKKVTASLKTGKLVKIEGANHSFKAGKLNTMDILVGETKNFIDKLLKRKHR